MEILIDNEYLTEFNQETATKQEIMDLIDEKIENKIIEKINVDDTEISFDYFVENINDKLNFDTINFITKDIDLLIEESLKKSSTYLPKLKKLLYTIADLYRDYEEKEALTKLNIFIDGIDWYTNILDKSLILIDDQDFRMKGKLLLEDFNQAINEDSTALNNTNYEYLADLLETKTADKIEELIKFNQEILEFVKTE